MKSEHRELLTPDHSSLLCRNWALLTERRSNTSEEVASTCTGGHGREIIKHQLSEAK